MRLIEAQNINDIQIHNFRWQATDMTQIRSCVPYLYTFIWKIPQISLSARDRKREREKFWILCVRHCQCVLVLIKHCQTNTKFVVFSECSVSKDSEYAIRIKFMSYLTQIQTTMFRKEMRWREERERLKEKRTIWTIVMRLLKSQVTKIKIVLKRTFYGNIISWNCVQLNIKCMISYGISDSDGWTKMNVCSVFSFNIDNIKSKCAYRLNMWNVNNSIAGSKAKIV